VSALVVCAEPEAAESCGAELTAWFEAGGQPSAGGWGSAADAAGRCGRGSVMSVASGSWLPCFVTAFVDVRFSSIWCVAVDACWTQHGGNGMQPPESTVRAEAVGAPMDVNPWSS
jgi:hypothetical protein